MFVLSLWKLNLWNLLVKQGLVSLSMMLLVNALTTSAVAAGDDLVTDAKAVESDGTISRWKKITDTFTKRQFFPQAQHKISQAGASEILQVTGVQVNSTDKGLEVILETADGTKLQVVNQSQGNSFIADLPNSQLNLPPSNTFSQDNPTPEITSITVTNQDANTIRVTVTGETGVPEVELFDDDQGLVFIFPPTESASQPETAEPTDQTDSSEPTPTSRDETIEITVTAEKFAADVQDIPISITAIPEQEIEDAQIRSLSDIAANTPNFTTFSGGGGDRSFLNYSIRGLGNVNFFGSDSVGFYIDDVPIDTGNATAFLNLNLVDLERVEVLRGPQGILYGRNSQAGVVNIITRKPTNTFEFNSNISYGNYNAFNAGASISGPLVEDRLFYRLTGNYSSRDGFLNNTFLNEDIDNQSARNVRSQLLWTPSDNWEIAFNAGFDDARDGGAPFVFLDQPDPFTTERDFKGFNDLTSNTQSLRVAYNHSDFRFTSITSRRNSRQDYETEGDLTTADIFRVIQEFETTVWNQEFRLQSPSNTEQLQWLVGSYFESRQVNNTDDGLQIGPDALSAFGFPQGTDVANSEVQTNIYAVFGQVSYRATNALTLTTGLRYESTNSTLQRIERTFTPVDGATMTNFSARDVENNSSALLPRFAIDYHFNPDLMVYGSVTRGFKPGGVNYRANNETILTFDAERSWNYEVGLKSSWLDDRLAVNLAVFHNPVQDYQVVFFDGITGLPQRVANADVRLTGAELEVRAVPVTGLNLIAGFGLVNSEFTDFSDPATGQSFTGNRLNFAPQFTYNLAAQYRSPSGILGRVELQGLGRTFFDEANTLKQEPYALVNARLGYEAENFGVYLFANNIFNTEYLSFVAPAFGGRNLALFGAPTTYGIQLQTRF
ncbi:TonB-dependent receptor [Nostocales cyanobacterium LEGE 11386]|nr:TonB-dependent receptor [Nostocales cyanobacterium LEGE 11386]